MMTKPLIHPMTGRQLTALTTHGTHAVLLSGASGMGKRTLADWLGAQVLGLPDGSFERYPYLLQLQPEESKTIPIEAVRQIEHFISLKIPSTHSIARLVIIYDAHLLGLEAQNALLKTLEEPPSDTMLVLTSSHLDALLPTLRSRMQSIEIIRPPVQQLQQALEASDVPAATINRILALSGGLPGLAFALANNDTEHPLVVAAQTARELLQQSTFDKLRQVDVLAKNKMASRNVLFILSQMAHAALITGKSGERWQKILAATYQAEDAINRGAQPKLVLTNLMLSL